MSMRSQLVAAILLFILLRMGLFVEADEDDTDDKLDEEPMKRLDKAFRARANSNTCPKLRLRNGRVRIRGGGRVARFICSPGFDMVGKRFATCVRGYWTNPPPVCVARGCDGLNPPKNGQVFESYKGAMVNFDCDPGYELLGSLSLHCDGYHWNASIPTCQPASKNPALECDFETEDLCGWLHDSTHDFDWQRHSSVTPSGHVGTGPSHDHTLGEGSDGHYMYTEASNPRKENDTARLVSPVYAPELSVDGCFTFWYHMYGATSGFLRVFVKPESLKVKDLPAIFAIAGDQGNTWFQGAVALPTLQENFQIVIEGIRGASYVSDTAVDDVKLTNTTTDCVMTHTPISPGGSSSGGSARNISGSCSGRCNVETADAEQCLCVKSCLAEETCCPDYRQQCISNGSSSSVLPDITTSATSSATEVSSSPIQVTSSIITSTVQLSSSIMTSPPPSDSPYSTLTVVPSSSTLPGIQTSISSTPVTKFVLSSSSYRPSPSPSVKPTSSSTITTSSPQFITSSFDQLSSLVESSAPPTMTSTNILRSSSVPVVTSAKRPPQPVTSIISSQQRPSISSSGPSLTSVITSKQEKTPVIPMSSSDFTNSVAVISDYPSSVVTSRIPSTSTIMLTTLVPSTCTASDSSCDIETSTAEMMTTLVPVVSTSITSSLLTTEQSVDIIKTDVTTSSETASIQPTGVLSTPIATPLLPITKESKSKSLLPSTATTPPPQSFSRAESAARTEKAGFPAGVTTGIVVAILLFGAVVGAAAYFAFKKRKLRREALAEDSDVRYLKDGEIQFGDGHEICL